MAKAAAKVARPTERRSTSFRLTGACRALLRRLADADGTSQAAVVELAVRERAERRGAGKGNARAKTGG